MRATSVLPEAKMFHDRKPTGEPHMQVTTTISGWVRAIAALTVAVMAGAMLSLSVTPARASVSDDESDQGSGLALSPAMMDPLVSNPDGRGGSNGVWVWRRGGRLFRLADHSGDTGIARDGFASVVAIDSQTLKEVGRAPLTPEALFETSQEAAQADRVGAVDEDGGRLFIGYHNPHRDNEDKTPWVGVVRTTLGNNSIWSSVKNPATLADGQWCPTVPGDGGQCINGVHVINAETLEVERQLLLRPLQVDGHVAAVRPRAMAYAPATEHFPQGKLLILLQDVTTKESVAPNLDPQSVTNTQNTYVVQLDPQTGRQDWALRIDACKNQREPRPDNRPIFHAEQGAPYSGAVLRTLVRGAPSLVAACHTGSQLATIVRVPLDAEGNPSGLPVTLNEPTGSALSAVESGASPDPQSVVTPAEQPEAFFGPDKTFGFIADAVAGRLLMKVVDNNSEVWWVFDTGRWQVLGTIGIGGGTSLSNLAGLDPVTGRLYVLSRKGLSVADARRTPVPQALLFPRFADLHALGSSANRLIPLTVVPASEQTPTRILVPGASGWRESDGASGALLPQPHRVIVDTLAVGEDTELDDTYAGRTLDLDEVAEVTQSTYDGTARGYGFRALLVGGVDAMTRMGPLDPPGAIWQFGSQPLTSDREVPGINEPPYTVLGHPRSPCTSGNRDVVLGFVGPGGSAVVDSTGGRGTAEPVVVDSAMRADGEAPASRCGAASDHVADWEQVWTKALFGSPPMEEPRVPWTFDNTLAECVSGAGGATDTTGDPVGGAYAAEVNCAGEETSGYAYARGTKIGDISVAQALSSFRIYRDPGRGIVARVESVTRGVHIPGLLKVDTVRGVAESWANGRQFVPPVEDETTSYDANCDFERTAGTCFVRHVVGVWTPGWSCGPCGDEKTLSERMSRGMGQYGSARLREPDPALAKGVDNGFIAAITRPNSERFADLVLNNDLLPTIVPVLEVIRYAPPNRPLTGGGPRGRQIYQFAGVEVSSSYGIACLLVYDEAANTCAEPAEAPGSIQVSLSDTDGRPLAGGAFEVRADVDADGVLGLKDTLLPDGACVTAEDGIGTCTFENLQPGSYLVSQVAAPPGYAKSAEPWVSEVASGERRTVAFTNVSNVSTIDLKATDEHGAPLSGAVFAAYPDADSDGKVAPDAQPAAECTTDAQGVCQMKVPAGSYVLVQTSAPGGLEGIEPVPFTFASGGQVASVSVVNYPPASPSQPEGAASPVYTPPVDQAPPSEFVSSYEPAPVDTVAPDIAPAPSVTERVGGTVTQVIRAPGDALRLLARDPKQAVAWTAALALFVLAAMAVRRRQHAIALIQQ